MQKESGSEEIVTTSGLSALREQTKSVMIPILIKAFELGSEAKQLADPPSRLHSTLTRRKPEEIEAELKALDNDLRLQEIWIASSRKQVEKILTEIRSQPGPPFTSQLKTNPSAHPGVQKSFENTFFAKKTKPPVSKSWWKKLLGI